ncbi:MAG: amidohydrolase [Acidobacteria bacterium]|nr:MAG: amidohydrolase [Acidobacteriota bacterium]
MSLSRFITVLFFIFTVTAFAGAQATDQSSAQTSAQIGYKSAKDADQRKTLLLKDFHPVSMLHAPVHKIDRAKYYVIDVHNHVNDAMGIEDSMPPQRVIEVMDNTNVKTVVILTGMWGEKLQKVLDTMVKPYPGRFIVFTQMDWSKIDDPNFSQEMVAQLDDAVGRGARGLKVLKDFGLGVKDKTGKLITVDDPRMDPVWEECGRLGIPVSIHVTDPEAFFHPIDNTNERYEELTDHPDWSFYGPPFPSKVSILEARDRVIARHPRTTFVALHLANWPENLDYVSGELEKYPNMMVEFGARQAELGRQPRRARDFFIKYQDRIMFGTDNGMAEEMYRNHFRWLETGDEYFDYWGYPGQGRWKIYGMELPDPVLEKIYHLNAERLFRQFNSSAKLQTGAK